MTHHPPPRAASVLGRALLGGKSCSQIAIIAGMDYGFPIQRSERCQILLQNMVSILHLSHLTDDEVEEICKDVIKRFGQGAEFEEDLPIFTAGLLPMQNLTKDIERFLADSPPIGDIEAVDESQSWDAPSYLLDVLNTLDFSDEDIVALGGALERIFITRPEFRFQLVPPKQIRFQIHVSDQRDESLASIIGQIIAEHERVAREADNVNAEWHPFRKREDTYDAIVRAYRSCISGETKTL